jgi:hypothetical protein
MLLYLGESKSLNRGIHRIKRVMKIINTLLLVLILFGLTSSLSAEEVRYDGEVAGLPITFWIDWKTDGKMSGNFWFDRHSQSFLGNQLYEGAIKLTDDNGDQMILKKVRGVWEGVIRGGQFDGKSIWFMRARATSTR